MHLPLELYFPQHWSTQMEVGWHAFNGTTVWDSGAEIRYKMPYASLFAGYRWLEAPTTHLRGPMLGVTMVY